MGRLQRSDSSGRKLHDGSVAVTGQPGREGPLCRAGVGEKRPAEAESWRVSSSGEGAGDGIASRGSKALTGKGIEKGTMAWELPAAPGTEPVAQQHMQEGLGPVSHDFKTADSTLQGANDRLRRGAGWGAGSACWQDLEKQLPRLD